MVSESRIGYEEEGRKSRTRSRGDELEACLRGSLPNEERERSRLKFLGDYFFQSAREAQTLF